MPGDVAWPTQKDRKMTALRWKDKKDVFFLGTIHPPLVVPAWVENDDSGTEADDERDTDDVVCRSVKVGGNWASKKIYRRQIVKSYNEFMGEVGLCDQMTAVNKSKKQKRWYLHVFIKMVLLCIYNAYIVEGHKRNHNAAGRRKRGLLSLKEDLCLELVGNFPQERIAEASNKRKRSVDSPGPAWLVNVGTHFPFKGEGRNHRCVVCERKHFLSKKINPNNPSPRHKTTFKCSQCDVYLCTGEGGANCFYDYHSKEDFLS